MARRKNWWKRLPEHIRKPLVLIVGVTLVVLSAFLGWIPGPGGIPLFLAGVAILATEYSWAERFKNYILRMIKNSTSWYSHHRVLGSTFASVGITIGLLVMIMLFL